MMLPVTSGFIFPNGEILGNNENGHRKTAEEYLAKKGLTEDFNRYRRETCGGEDEYLVDVLKAAKIWHRWGQHWLYIPRLHGENIKQYIDEYKSNGYTIKNDDNDPEEIQIIKSKYNQTVVEYTDEDGNKYYAYNPNKDGD